MCINDLICIKKKICETFNKQKKILKNDIIIFQYTLIQLVPI